MNRLFVSFFAVSVFLTAAYCFCSNDESSIAKYEDIKDLPNHPEILLIDVREPQEILESGKIPTSINIPLGTLKDTLTSTTEKDKFAEKYGRKFPLTSDEIIFTCRSGRRAKDAMDSVCSLGFNRVKYYKGSWLEWAEKEGWKP